jgi:membrane protein DedA with SNARE-associated domain
MPCPRLPGFIGPGRTVRGTVVVLAGYAAGTSYAQVQRSLLRYSAFVVVPTVALVAWLVR